MGEISVVSRRAWRDCDTVAAWLDALREGRWDAAADYVTEDVAIEDPPSLPHGGRRTVHEHAEAFERAWLIDPATTHEIVEGGDSLVLVHTTGHATARATGRGIELDIRTLVFLRDGRIELARAYWRDTAEALSCLRP